MSSARLLDLLLEITTVLSEDQQQFAASLDLTPARLHLLWVLGEHGPLTQRALADALGVAPRTVTGLVDALATSGHLSREIDPADRRAHRVTLTPIGEDVMARLSTGHAELADALFAHLGADRRMSAEELFADLVRRLRALVAADRP